MVSKFLFFFFLKTGREATSAATRAGSRSGEGRRRGPTLPAVRAGVVRQAQGGRHRPAGARLQGHLLGRQGETGLVQESGYFLSGLGSVRFLVIHNYLQTDTHIQLQQNCSTVRNPLRRFL